jgi:hypothetical protein
MDCHASSITSAFAESSRHSVAGSEDPVDLDLPEISGSQRDSASQPSSRLSSTEGHVSLSEVHPLRHQPAVGRM